MFKLTNENNSQELKAKITDVKSKNKNGTSRQELLNVSQSGDHIFLVPYPNEFDKTAVKVMSEPLNEQLGWLDSSLSKDIFNWIRNGKEYQAEIEKLFEAKEQDDYLECIIKIKKIKNTEISSEEQGLNLEYDETLGNEKLRSEVNPRSPLDILIYKMHKASEKINSLGCFLILILVVSIILYLLIKII